MSTFEQEFAEICAMEGPLSERLLAIERIIRHYDPAFADAYDDLVAGLKAGAVGNNAPQTGQEIPPFLLPNQDNRLISLSELLGKGPVVVSFNRGHWCEFCDVELRAFARAHMEFQAHGASVVAIMPDHLQFIKKVRARTQNAFEILCDMDNSYAMEVNLVMWLGERVRKLFTGIGLDVNRFQGNDAWFVPLPATFVLDDKGIIVARYVDPDFRRRMEIEEILATLAAIKG
jgi:peroxiredoxin